jgi:hypothetical protein
LLAFLQRGGVVAGVAQVRVGATGEQPPDAGGPAVARRGGAGLAQQPASAKIGDGDAGTTPITRASGKKKTALARHVHSDRLVDAVHRQGFCALIASPTARNCTAEATATAAR